MILETTRLILRDFVENDFDDLYEYLSDFKTLEFEPYKPMNSKQVKLELQKRIKSNEYLAVVLKDENKVIGNLYLGNRKNNTIELGYVFNYKYWKNGYGIEACECLINSLFKQDIKRIYAECDPINKNSWHLLERLGFIREEYLVHNVYFFKDEKGEPIWKDTYVYGLNNDKKN